MPGYNPQDWYWIVGGYPDTQVFASGRGQFVPTNDQDFLAWQGLSHEHRPSRILNADELYEALLAVAPEAAARGVAALEGNLAPAKVAQLKMAAGLPITSQAHPELSATYPMDLLTIVEVTSVAAGLAEGKGMPMGLPTVSFPDISGNLHQFNEAEFKNWAACMRDYFAGVNQAARAFAMHQDGAAWPSTPVSMD